MTFMLVLSGAVIAALILSGRAKNMGTNDWLAVAVALIGVNLCRGGNWLVGGGVIAAAVAWSGSKILGIRKAGRQDHSRAEPAPDAQELAHARAVLVRSPPGDHTGRRTSRTAAGMRSGPGNQTAPASFCGRQRGRRTINPRILPATLCPAPERNSVAEQAGFYRTNFLLTRQPCPTIFWPNQLSPSASQRKQP